MAVPGVIGFRPIHLIPRAERERVADMSKAAIDTALPAQRAEKLVKVGDYVSFRTGFETLSEDGLRAVKGKAFDDRAGCAVLVELLKQDYSFDLYAVFTAQEEVGLRGAQVAAYVVNPIWRCPGGHHRDDLPRKGYQPCHRSGQRAGHHLYGSLGHSDRRLVDLLVNTAKRLGIPNQFKRAAEGGTDAGPFTYPARACPRWWWRCPPVIFMRP
jgi:endoglucanase